MHNAVNTSLSRRQVGQIVLGAGIGVSLNSFPIGTASAAPSSDPDEYSLNWKFDTEHEFPLFSVTDSYVYTDGPSELHALNPDSGDIGWTFPAQDSFFQVYEGEKTIYASGRDNAVYAIKKSSGTEQWRFGTSGVPRGPVVTDDYLFLGDYDGNVYSINKSDGTSQWVIRTENGVANVDFIDSKSAYVQFPGEGVSIVDITTGESKWDFGLDTSWGAGILTDDLYIVTDLKNAVFGLDKTDGTIEWQIDIPVGVPLFVEPINDTVYVASYDDNVYAIDPDDGSVIWSFATGASFNHATYHNNSIYMSSRDDNVYKIDPETGQRSWQVDTGAENLTPPAILGDTVFAGNRNGEVNAIDEASGDLLWTFETEGEVWGVESQEESILFSSLDEHIYSLNVVEASSTLDAIDDTNINIEFVNKFRTESTQGFLEGLYGEVQQALPVDDPTIPDENKAYIQVDVRVEIDEEFDVERVQPIFTHELTEETFSTSNVENFLGADPNYDRQHHTLSEIEDNVFGWDNFRMRTPTQVGIQVLETAAMAISAGAAHGEVTNPIQADTDTYPDVFLTALALEDSDGNTVRVDVNERLPRADDVCTSVGFSGFLNDECPIDGMDGFENGAMVLSPATVAIEDDQGRVTGRIREDNEYIVRNEIPGALYSGALRHEFVLAPEGDHRVIVNGQEKGEATVVIDRIEAEQIHSTVYQDVNVDSETRIQGEIEGQTMLVENGDEEGSSEELSPDVSQPQSPNELFNVRMDADSSGLTTEKASDMDDDGEDQTASGDEGDEETRREGRQNDEDDTLPIGLSTPGLAAGGVVTAGLVYLAARMLSDGAESDDATP